MSELQVNPGVTVTELRRLLVGISEHEPNTGFRFRRMGELWHPAFLTIVSVSDRNALLLNQSTNRLITIELSNIMQFEIELGHQEFLPNFHYTVTHLV